MEYVYHKKEDGSIAGAYPLKDADTDKIVGGAAVAHLGVPVGLVIETSCERSCEDFPYIEEDSEEPFDFEKFDDMFSNIAKIEGTKGSSDAKKTRKRRKSDKK
jgi:hypothetical protein